MLINLTTARGAKAAYIASNHCALPRTENAVRE